MRPYVDKCQDLPNSLDRFAPKKASDITANALVMKWMQRWPFRPIAAKLWFATADSIDLPDYVLTRRVIRYTRDSTRPNCSRRCIWARPPLSTDLR